MLLPLLMNLGMLGQEVPGGGDSSRRKKKRQKKLPVTPSNFSFKPEIEYPSIPIEVKKTEIGDPPDDEDMDDQILIALVSRLIH